MTTEAQTPVKKYLPFRVPLQRADGFWIVSDMYAAAFFLARGNEIVAVEPTADRARKVFVICARREFFSDREAFESNSPIPVRDFLDAVYRVKQKINEATRYR